jgi:hypothetical protein
MYASREGEHELGRPFGCEWSGYTQRSTPSGSTCLPLIITKVGAELALGSSGFWTARLPMPDLRPLKGEVSAFLMMVRSPSDLALIDDRLMPLILL